MIKKQYNIQRWWQHPKELVLFSILLVLLLSILLCISDEVAYIYFQKVFPLLRSLFDAIHIWIRFPLFYIITVFLIASLFVVIYKVIKRYKNYRSYLNLINYFLFLFCLFQILWGINYKVNPLQHYDDNMIQVDSSVLFFHFKNQTSEVNRLRQLVLHFPDRKEIEKILLKDFKANNAIFEDLKLPKPSPLSIKYLFSGAFLNFNTAGMYFPFTGECLVDIGLHPLQIPPVAAHEWFHGSGVTDEGQCSFLAWLVCARYSDNILVKYAAELDIWKDMAPVVRSISSVRYTETLSILDPLVTADIKEIYENSLKFSNRFDFIQRKIYNNYLKSQGIKEGVRSYGKVVNYVLFYLENENRNPEL